MDNTLHMIAIWMHIFGIALWVGPQFFLAFAWIPASRGITDLQVRAQAMRTITTRFGWLGGAGLVIIVIAGIYLISTWRDFYAQPSDLEFTGIRYGVIFIIKMNVLILMLAVAGLHMLVVGPRLLRLYEAQAAGETVTEAQLKSARRASMSLSMLGLLLTLVIMVMGVMLSTQSFSFQET